MEDDDTDDELDAVPLEASAAPTSAVAEAIPSTHPHVSTCIPHQPRPAEESLPAWWEDAKTRFAKLCLDVDVL